MKFNLCNQVLDSLQLAEHLVRDYEIIFIKILLVLFAEKICFISFIRMQIYANNSPHIFPIIYGGETNDMA